MGLDIIFPFRKVTCTCTAIIDATETPVYIFVMLRDKELIKTFGSEITIETDFRKVLPRRDDTASIVELRQAVFNALLDNAEFQAAKALFRLGN